MPASATDGAFSSSVVTTVPRHRFQIGRAHGSSMEGSVNASAAIRKSASVRRKVRIAKRSGLTIAHRDPGGTHGQVRLHKLASLG